MFDRVIQKAKKVTVLGTHCSFPQQTLWQHSDWHHLINGDVDCR